MCSSTQHANANAEIAFEKVGLWVLSDDLRAIMISMLSLDPKKRPTALQILAHPLINQALVDMLHRKSKVVMTLCDSQ